MTLIEEAVIAKLKATSAITALVSTRVWQLMLPQGPTLPAIKVQLVDKDPSHHLRGTSKTFQTRVQVDTYAAIGTVDAYKKANDIADAVEAVLDGKAPFTSGDLKVTGGFLMTRTPAYEAEEIKAVRVRQDFAVWGKVLS